MKFGKTIVLSLNASFFSPLLYASDNALTFLGCDGFFRTIETVTLIVAESSGSSNGSQEQDGNGNQLVASPRIIGGGGHNRQLQPMVVDGNITIGVNTSVTSVSSDASGATNVTNGSVASSAVGSVAGTSVDRSFTGSVDKSLDDAKSLGTVATMKKPIARKFYD